MAVVGIGVDAVDVPRFAAVLERRPRLAQRVFSARERDLVAGSSAPSRSLAARFAAKEAVVKALGTGMWSLRFSEIEVLREPTGPPRLELSGSAGELAARAGIGRWHVSLTHTDQVAVASVVAETLETPAGHDGQRG